MKKIGIIDADLMDNGTRHPNLALMKISGYYKELGDDVHLIYHSYDEVIEYDEIYISKVFTFTEIPELVLLMPNVTKGGTGFYEDGGADLPEQIEHHMPDYKLYDEYVNEELDSGKKRMRYSDYLDYSIGFMTRGCFRKCDFCVNKKYDKANKHSALSEFYNKDKPYIYLWDDNILAYSQWENVLDDLETTNKPFQFRQGIDLRLMTDRKAYRLNHTHYHGDFIFAFDNLKDKDLLIDKIQLWKRYSSKVCKMYVLSGFESQDEKDIESVFERISVLMKYGSIPYIMRYEKYKCSPFRGMYIELARWCNQPQFFKKKSFREFCVANQYYKKNKETNCASYQAMLDFEKEFPGVAERYFDLRFDQENMYLEQYGYGRKYANKPLCSKCKNNGVCWQEILKNDKKIEEKFLMLYLTKEIDLQCLEYKNSECNNKEEIGNKLIHILLRYNIMDIIEIIRRCSSREDITKENIPQYSSLDDAVINVNKILIESGQRMDFNVLGYYLESAVDSNLRQSIALKKYGENHAKLATLMDLAVISKMGVKSNIKISVLGQLFYSLQPDQKEDLAKKLCLRIPIIQNMFFYGVENRLDKDLKILSNETKKRRRSNVINMVRWIIDGNMELINKYEL